MKTIIIVGMLLLGVATSSTLRAQTNSDELAQLKQRVVQLEKQVQEISQFLEPLKGQQAIIFNRREALKGKVSARFALDREKYSPDQVLEAEKLYQVISQKPGTSEASESFQALIKKFPDNNRTGCATLYIAQRSQGEERIKYLQECIAKYNGCMYGDGVQVGVYARFLLAREYIAKGEVKQSEALVNELKNNYADAVDHGGNLLLDAQGRLTK